MRGWLGSDQLPQWVGEHRLKGDALTVAQLPAVRVAAVAAGTALMSNLSEYAVIEVLHTLLAGLELKKLWQTKVLSPFH